MNQPAGDRVRHASLRPAPSPPRLPVLGHALAFRRNPPQFLRQAAEACGPVARLKLGPLTYHLVSEPALVAEILQSRAANYLRDTRSSRRIRLLTGESLLTSEGPVWRQQRHDAQPMFHQRRIAELAATMAQVADEACVAWERAAESGRRLDLAAEMSRLSFAVAGRCLFGADLRDRAADVERALPVLLDELFRRTTEVAALPLWVPWPRHARFHRARAAVDRVVAALIADHRTSDPASGDLLSLFRRAQAEGGRGGGEAELRDQVLTFLLAGHETTASALTWAFALLAASPNDRDAVEAELAALRVATGGGSAVVETGPKLVRLNAVLQETLRLYPSIWIAERRVVSADELGGWRIPARSSVIVSPFVTHRLPEWWEEPDAFRPQRFLGNEPFTLARQGYFPFGAGPHACIGQHFALMEARIILATLSARFRVVLLDGALPPPLGGLTLRPATEVPVRIERRPA